MCIRETDGASDEDEPGPSTVSHAIPSSRAPLSVAMFKDDDNDSVTSGPLSHGTSLVGSPALRPCSPNVSDGCMRLPLVPIGACADKTRNGQLDVLSQMASQLSNG